MKYVLMNFVYGYAVFFSVIVWVLIVICVPWGLLRYAAGYEAEHSTAELFVVLIIAMTLPLVAYLANTYLDKSEKRGLCKRSEL